MHRRAASWFTFVACVGLGACGRSTARQEHVTVAGEPAASRSAVASAAAVASVAASASAGPAGPPPTSCRVLVNLGQPTGTHHVVELRIAEKISMTTKPGLVAQDGLTLFALQLIHYEQRSNVRGVKLFRGWSSLVATKLPDGRPETWVHGETELPDLDGNPGDWYRGNSLQIASIVGPFVSVVGHDVLSTGALYFGDAWPAFVLSAPTGTRVSLPAIIGEDAVAPFKDKLRPQIGETPDESLGPRLGGFALVFDKPEGGPPSLAIQASTSSSVTGPRIPLAGPPIGVFQHLTVSTAPQLMIGHPRGCAEIGFARGALTARRTGETKVASLPLPPHLRGAELLGAVWITIDHPFTLSQLSPSGSATDPAIAKVAPPVKFRPK